MTGVRGALEVRINDGRGVHYVTRQVQDLRFRKTAPGGHQAASCRLIVPHSRFDDLGPADRFYVDDARNGRTVWEGYTENPGTSDGRAGQSYDLSVLGGMVLASDQARKLPYLDRRFDKWQRDPLVANAASARAELSTNPDTGGDALVFQFNPGQPITTLSRAQLAYRALADADMGLGAYGFSWDGGKTDSNYEVQSSTGTDPAYNEIPYDVGLTNSGSATSQYIGTDFPVGRNIISLRLIRILGGATTVADDNTWLAVTNVRVLGRRMDRFGTEAASLSDMGSSSIYVLASWIVEDLLGRMLHSCDPNTAEIATTSYQISQFAFHEAVRAAAVLEELALYEPDFYWGIGASNPQGRHRFWYRQWPTTTPRYVISVKDEYQGTGGEVDLCNRLAVSWTDPSGQSRVTVVTADVPELGGDPDSVGFSGRIRDAEPIYLDSVTVADDAERIGQGVLDQLANPGKFGTAVVRRPILDRSTGATVMPWEIEPGYLVLVRETGDLLRLTEMEYVDDDVATTLTLGQPVRTLEQRLARLSRGNR